MKKMIGLTVLLLWVIAANSQQQRALVIGIDNYDKPEGYTSASFNPRIIDALHGAKNDALSMYSIITSKFSFKASDTKLLLDQSASRAAIMGGLDTLLRNSQPGDIAFLFFAGHGTEIRNSLSGERGKMDQAIIPADQWKEGVHDIRDKDLSDYFNRFVQKKVYLTVIFDCCNSGSISRGPNISERRARFAPGENYDPKDARVFPAPEKQGDYFLIFSACQRDERALEDTDYVGANHGAFTAAFSKALAQQSVDADALSIFTATSAIMKARGFSQEPIIGGSTERQSQTLFGIKKGLLADDVLVPVSDTSQNRIGLQAGIGIGLFKGSELAMMDGKNEILYKLRVDSVTGINHSIASVIKGDIKSISPGYLFRVVFWAGDPRPALNIYVPKSTLTADAVAKAVSVAKELANNQVTQMKWTDLASATELADPYLTVFWRDNQCYVKADKAQPKPVSAVNAQAILREGLFKKDSSLYVELPVSKENAELIVNKLQANNNIRLVNEPQLAQYMVFGKLGANGRPAYGFRKVDFSVKDSLNLLPLFTDCFELPEEKNSKLKSVPDSLAAMVQKLYKLNRWMNMSLPSGGAATIPYQLSISDYPSKKIINNGKYQVNQNVYLMLKANPAYKQTESVKRYAYVFTMGSDGAMQILYPFGEGSVNNGMAISGNGRLNKDVLLDSFIVSGKGTDTYFLLLCDGAIPDPSKIFKVEALNSGVVSRGTDPLSELLKMEDPELPRSRGMDAVSRTYQLQRISFRIRP